MNVLAIHILFATVTLALCILAWFKPTSKLFTPLLISSLVSIVTGIMVSLDSSILTTCTKLGVYSLVIAVSLSKIYNSTKHLNQVK